MDHDLQKMLSAATAAQLLRRAMLILGCLLGWNTELGIAQSLPETDLENVSALQADPIPTAPADGEGDSIVRLHDGRQIKGRVKRERDYIEVRVGKGKTRIALKDVLAIEESADQEYQRLALDANGRGADAHLALAREMEGKKQLKWAYRELRLALLKDPDQADARVALGHVRVADRWLTPAEACARAEALLVEGRWDDANMVMKLLEAALIASRMEKLNVEIATRDRVACTILLARGLMAAGQIGTAGEKLVDFADSAPSEMQPRLRALVEALAECPSDGMVEIFQDEVSLDFNAATDSRALHAGKAPIWDSRVLAVLLRRAALRIVDRLKSILVEAEASERDRNAPEALARLGAAERLADNANALVPEIAHSYQVQAAVRQLSIFAEKTDEFVRKAEWIYSEWQRTYGQEGSERFADSRTEWRGWAHKAQEQIDGALKIALRYSPEMDERIARFHNLKAYIKKKFLD